MRLKSQWIGACLAASVVSAPLSNVAFAQDEAQKVEGLSKEATSKYREKDYAAAIELFQKAYEIEPVPNLLFNIAKCYEKLEQWDPAIEYYQKFVVEPDVDKSARQSALDRIDALKEVQSAQKQADRDAKQTETAKKTEKKAEPIEVGPDYTWAYVTLGTGVALVGGGIVFGVLASGEETTFNQGQTFEERKDAKDAGETYAIVADGLYVAGGIIAVVGVLLFVTADSGTKDVGMASQGEIKAFGWVGQDGGGVGLSSVF